MKNSKITERNDTKSYLLGENKIKEIKTNLNLESIQKHESILSKLLEVN